MTAPISDCYACARVPGVEHAYRCPEELLATTAGDITYWLESLADWLDIPATADERDLRMTAEGVDLALAVLQEHLDRLVVS